MLIKYQKIMHFFLIILCLSSLFLSTNAQAWEHEIAFGFGDSGEPEQDYTNTLFVLSGKFLKYHVDKTLIATLDGTLGFWTAHTDEHKHVVNIAVSPAFRAYFADPDYHRVRPYLGISVGPTYISDKQLGNRLQNTHFALQSTLEAGTEIGNSKHSVDLNVHLTHICNAGLADPNQSYNLLYVFSIGYQF
ncbi:MAG TPA: acyloxyacyl hydrolase [Gammaproteobacteria bacterium]|nr:acyloxyacyl hydrolase [Gammaproteobacteria bacterium]